MKSMPRDIKQKIRQVQKNAEKTKMLSIELNQLFGRYDDVDTSRLDATCDPYDYKPIVEYTDALSSVINAEGDVEENIKEIERVFLLMVNGKN